MTTGSLVLDNLRSPPVLAFALGFLGSLLRADLRLPAALHDGASMYLLLAIGLKGGAALAGSDLPALGWPLLATLALGLLLPSVAYAAARRLGRLPVADAASLAAHYGSVSVVTFTAAAGLMHELSIAYEPFLPALVAVLEVPAILVALALARRGGAGGRRHGGWWPIVREALAGRTALLLGGGVAIGAACGHTGLAAVDPFFVLLFHGILTLFLLDMGAIAGSHLSELRQAGPFLVGFGLVAPLLHGALGALLGVAAGLSTGGATLLATMAASASYIAAPAAVRAALPEARVGLSLAASLAVTFPFNLVVGIPLYHAIATALA